MVSENNFQKTVVSSGESIATAAEVLTKTSMRIVLVVDKSNRLLGTVTDGDIRRAVMNGVGMDSKIDQVMTKKPIVIHQGEERRKILQLMREKDILQVPIVDESSRVVGLEVVQDFVYGAKKPNLVLLMAGGFGRRLRPLTSEVPKPLLRVGNKPILELIIEQLAEAGFQQFYMAVHYKSEQVKTHFGDGSNWGVTIEYLEEDQPLGTAGALGLLNHELNDVPLLMMNGDLLTQLSFDQLLEYHVAHGGVATMCVREYDFQVPYGVVQGDGVHVEGITEKPVQKYFVNAGIYVLEPQLVKQYDVEQSKDMPDLLQAVVEAGAQVNMFPIHEYWLDIGRMEEYERAQLEVFDLNFR
jgi:dTDP-glucose pyrophosphorylase